MSLPEKGEAGEREDQKMDIVLWLEVFLFVALVVSLVVIFYLLARWLFSAVRQHQGERAEQLLQEWQDSWDDYSGPTSTMRD